jgi:hypothetical protein
MSGLSPQHLALLDEVTDPVSRAVDEALVAVRLLAFCIEQAAMKGKPTVETLDDLRLDADDAIEAVEALAERIKESRR